MNAGSVYASMGPGFESGQAMTAQSGGIQAGLDQAAANNTLNVSNFNASMAALQDKLGIAQAQENYNAGGVLPSGSPMGALNQARLLATANINQTMQQGLFQANNQNTNAVQTINATRSQLLGNANTYTSGLANADITQENAQAKLAWGLASLGASVALGPIGGAAMSAIQGLGGSPAPNTSNAVGSPGVTINQQIPSNDSDFTDIDSASAGWLNPGAATSALFE
jgi:hypothetical protein